MGCFMQEWVGVEGFGGMGWVLVGSGSLSVDVWPNDCFI